MGASIISPRARRVARNLLLRLAGGKMLLRRYNWLYDWRARRPKRRRPNALPRRNRTRLSERNQRMFPTTIAG